MNSSRLPDRGHEKIKHACLIVKELILEKEIFNERQPLIGKKYNGCVNLLDSWSKESLTCDALINV